MNRSNTMDSGPSPADTGANPGPNTVTGQGRSRLRRVPVWLWALILGAAAGAGQAPLGWWALALPALAGQAALLRGATTLRQAALWGWAVGLGYVCVTHYWIVAPFFVDAARHGWMAPFALVAITAGLALLWGAAFALAFFAGWGPGARVLIWPFAMALAEYVRAHLFTGFPWAPLAALWLPTPVAQAGALIGPYGLGLLACLIAALAVVPGPGVRRAGALALGAVVLGAGLGFGLWRLSPGSDAPGSDAPVIRIVQPNAAQHLKWRPDMVPEFFRRQLALSAAAPAPGGRRPDLIVWPETAVAYGLDNAGAALSEMRAAAGGAPVLFGVQRRDGARFFNAMALLGADGRIGATYDKHHLVPFGEYIPFGDLLARVGITAFAAQSGNGYSSGPGPGVLDLGAAGTALPLICYEAIFAHDLRLPAGTPRPDFIVVITNDAWFGPTSMPYQHLDQARLRAIEQGLPVIRAANTGISAVIDAQGRVRDRLALGQTGALDAALPASVAKPLYARSGDLPFVMVLALVGFFVASLRRYR